MFQDKRIFLVNANGLAPDQFKVARVVPIHKKGSSYLVSAKSASQRAMRATVRAMRVMRFASVFWSRVWEVVDHFAPDLSPNNRYKPLARHLEC